MSAKHALQSTMRSFLVFRKERPEPLWAQLVVGVALVFAIALVLMTVSIFLMALPHAGWWSSSLGNNLLLGAVIGSTMLLVLRATEWLLPARAIDALARMREWRQAALVSLVLMAGLALGIRLAYVTLSYLYNFDMWRKLSGVPLVQLKFFIFALVVGAANWTWWMLQAKEKALARQTAESQLRMLQAQIEPHFLFNTLANVQSLIRTDAPRAQLMLESFTDYLRASLVQMRNSDVTLELELATARSYLQLMQIRMGRRLRFSIDASDLAREAMLPPFLLQPLVENAVHHGLEGKIGGGSVHLYAIVEHGMLEVRVDDDGIGLEEARYNPRAGNGTALANVRARLQTRYAGAASLLVTPLDQGTRATLALPWSGG